MASEDQRRNIVIIGGGIIGSCSAYFLTRHPSFNAALHTITLVEATSIASGASGKAGGLLALWAYSSCLVPLSYRLHTELAAEHGGAARWGYRKVYSGSLSAKGSAGNVPSRGARDENRGEWVKLPKLDEKARKATKAVGVPEDLDWFDAPSITSYSEMGNPSNTAQVHPYQFTTSMATLASEKGAKIIIGSVTAIDHAGNQVRGVTYETKASEGGKSETHTLPATDIVIAAGPWTSQIFPAAPIDALRAHSVTIKADVSPYAVFSEISLPANFAGKKNSRGKVVTPEMYARPNGEVYACGEGDTLVPLPKSSDLVQCDEERCDEIVEYVGSISRVLAEGEVLVKQACYLPMVGGGAGGPLIGSTAIKGLFLAAGHTCWGIQNGPGTGKLISELVWEGEMKSADVKSLDPRLVL